jgi:hypothetical protein
VLQNKKSVHYELQLKRELEKKNWALLFVEESGVVSREARRWSISSAFPEKEIYEG